MSNRRVVPAIVATVLVIGFGVLYEFRYNETYMTLLTSWGVHPFEFPFLDTHAVLSAIECHRRGIDVYVENPCDVLGRIHVYSPLWLLAAVLPITTTWTPVVGLACVTLFLLSLTLLPAGHGWWQTSVITLGTISSTTAFAIERANIDLVVFVLAVLVGRFTQQRQALRLLGYCIALLAGMLKFYPATLLILALRERLAIFIAIGLMSAGAMASFIVCYAHDLPHLLASIPTFSDFNFLSFGARNLPYGLVEVFGWPSSAGSRLLVALTISTVLYATVLARRGDLPEQIDSLSPAEAAFLLIGCVLLVGCFFTAQNVLYRGIHFLFVLPALTTIMRRPGERPNIPLVLGCALVLLLMWGESVHLMVDWALKRSDLPARYVGAVEGCVWILHEIMWWAVITMLITLIIAVLRRSEVAGELFIRFSIHRRR